MGHPINSLDYVLTQWDNLKDRHPYYAFILFTDEHRDFFSLVQEQFIHWDQLSGEACMFFTIAPPPENWLAEANTRDYWRHYIANSENDTGYDVDAVKQAARYFDIPYEYLPAIVLFNDLKRYDTITIHLAGLSKADSSNLINNLFLFLNHPFPQRYRELWRLQSLIDRLPISRKYNSSWIDKYVRSQWTRSRSQRPSNQVMGESLIPHRFTYLVNAPQSVELTLSNLVQELRRLSDEVAELRNEQCENFREVNVRLERIEVVLRETITRIEEYRRPFVVRWMTADTETDFDEAEHQRSILHSEFDEFLEQQSRYLSERLFEELEPQLPDELSYIDDQLEPESKAKITTAEVLWKHLTTFPPSFMVDYAVCGVGLWTALEVEINRAFVDALRVRNALCQTGQPSVHQTVRPIAKMFEDGRFGNQIKPVRINYYDPQNLNKLRGIELGGSGPLMAASDVNSLSEIITDLHFPLEQNDTTIHEFMLKLAERVNEVRTVYRNSYAHIQQMDRATYEEFRSLMLNRTISHSPLFAIVECKQMLLRAGLI
ncbi:MAG: hypothetical protein M5U01_00330 [Ardenticatenaceae bacterium]|nr:hypothetical protein [Ardenticatenaceae bacterium]